jgi:hypothetical protein
MENGADIFLGLSEGSCAISWVCAIQIDKDNSTKDDVEVAVGCGVGCLSVL